MIYLGSYNFLYENIIKQIKNIRKNDKKSKISFIIFSNTMRKALKQYITDELGILYNSEFFTKIDLAKNILKENPISNLEKEILIKNIIQKNSNYINDIEKEYFDIFQSLKEEKNEDNSNISEEIKSIFTEYNSFLKENNHKDREDLIRSASKFNFKSDYIFIFGFQSLSLIDRNLLEKVINNNDKEKIKIFLPLDLESSIYKNNNYLETYVKFFRSFGFSEIKEENINDNIKITRLLNSKTILKESLNLNNLNFIKVKGIKQEIKYLAKYILFLRENKNISWNKIGIIINDIENYIDTIKETFNDYKIPYYLFHENRYIDDINFKKIFSILNLKVNDFNKNDLLNSISTNILNIDNINISSLEKILIENYFENGFENLSKLLDNNLLNIFNDLNQIQNENSLTNFITLFREFINKHFKENIYKSKILEILEQIKNSTLLNKCIEIITLEDFNKIILKYLEQENKENRMTGNIVEIATPAIALSLKFEHLFFIDMNEGKYPILKDESFLLHKYPKLKELVSKKEILYSQQLLTFINLFNSSKNNYIFYKDTDDNGNELSPSILVDELLNYQFGQNQYQELISKDILEKQTIKEFKLENSKKLLINDFFDLINMNSKIENQGLSVYEGYFDNNYLLYSDKKLTPSQLQKYIDCPYKFFIRYIIKPEENKIYDLEQISYDKLGEIIHKILEEIYKEYKYYTENNHLLEEFIKNKFKKYFEPLLNQLKKDSIIFEKLKLNSLEKNITEFIKSDLNYLRNNNYEIYSLEREFSININDYEIIGRIDRIDKLINQDSYNIYDYKVSKAPNNDLEKEIEKGNFIQLYLYRKFLESEKKEVNQLGIFFLKELGNKIKEIISYNNTNNFEQKINLEISLINKNFFSPYVKSDKCYYCDYSSICGKKYRDKEIEEKFLNSENGKNFYEKIKNEKYEKN